MKFLLPLLLTVTPAGAIPATTALTLVTEPGFNRLDVTADPQIDFGLSLASSSTTTLTGTMLGEVNANPDTGQTSELTLRDGRVSATKLTFRKSIFLIGTVYHIELDGISASITTPTPPGLVDAASGGFAADQHQFEIDQGTATGTVSIPGQPSVPVDESFSPENPVTGGGSGTGTVTLTPTGESGIFRNFDIVVILPVDLDDTFDAGENAVRVTASGTIKATGTLKIPLSEYLAWTVTHAIEGASGRADANGDGVSNAIAWALGLDASVSAIPFVPTVSAGGFQLQLPATETVAPIRIQGSGDLGIWVDLPTTRISTGLNPLPAGSGGLVTITPSGTPLEFIRLHVEE
ncbi:hypothetical protein BH23VER1_BH23VER1_00590 [soil metagenome]